MEQDGNKKRRRPFRTSHAQIIEYPRLMELYSEISKCLQMSPSANESQNIALDGPAGAGKTTLVKRLAELYPKVETSEGDIITVLYNLVLAPITTKGLISGLLNSLGDPAAYRGPLYLRTQRLINLLNDCETEVVIVDDIHHLIDQKGRVLSDVANCLKSIIKGTETTFILVGIEGAVDDIIASDNTGELARLFTSRKTLHPFKWNNEEPATISEFSTFVRYAEKILGMDLTSQTERLDLIYRIFYATDGVVDSIMKLLRQGVTHAKEHNRHAIGLEDLSFSFQQSLSRRFPKKRNPFIGELSELFK